MTAEEVRERVRGAAGEARVEVDHGVCYWDVQPAEMPQVAGKAKSLGFTYFSFMTAVDWPEPEEGEPYFELVYWLSDLQAGGHLVLRTRVGRDQPRVLTLTAVYSGADWHEREAMDFFGIVFEGHPDPRPILLPEDFDGHPLRKDFDVLEQAPKFRREKTGEPAPWETTDQ